MDSHPINFSNVQVTGAATSAAASAVASTTVRISGGHVYTVSVQSNTVPRMATSTDYREFGSNTNAHRSQPIGFFAIEQNNQASAYGGINHGRTAVRCLFGSPEGSQSVRQLFEEGCSKDEKRLIDTYGHYEVYESVDLKPGSKPKPVSGVTIKDIILGAPTSAKPPESTGSRESAVANDDHSSVDQTSDQRTSGVSGFTERPIDQISIPKPIPIRGEKLESLSTSAQHDSDPGQEPIDLPAKRLKVESSE